MKQIVMLIETAGEFIKYLGAVPCHGNRGIIRPGACIAFFSVAPTSLHISRTCYGDDKITSHAI